MCVCAYTHVCACMRVCVLVCACACTHVQCRCVCACVHALACVCVHAFVCTCACVNVCACVYVCVCMGGVCAWGKRWPVPRAGGQRQVLGSGAGATPPEKGLALPAGTTGVFLHVTVKCKFII